MLKKGMKVVAVKLDSKGCYVTDGKKSRYVEAFTIRPRDHNPAILWSFSTSDRAFLCSTVTRRQSVLSKANLPASSSSSIGFYVNDSSSPTFLLPIIRTDPTHDRVL